MSFGSNSLKSQNGLIITVIYFSCREDQPEYYQWALGENGNVGVSSEEFCSKQIFNFGAYGVYDIYGYRSLMVPAPQVVEDLCALRKRSRALFIMKNVNGTCIANQNYCTSDGFTWSVWLRLRQVFDGHHIIIQSGSYTDTERYIDQTFTFNLWVTHDRLLFCSAYNNNNNNTIARGINISNAIFNDKWFHIACVFNFTTNEDGDIGHAKAYINGIENIEQTEIDNYLLYDDYTNYYFSKALNHGVL